MRKLKRIWQSLSRKYNRYKIRIYILSVIIVFVVFRIDYLRFSFDSDFSSPLFWIFFTFFIYMSLQTGIYLYKHLHVILRYLLLAAATFLFLNYEERAFKPISFLWFMGDQLAGIFVLTAYSFIPIAVVDFFIDFYKWFKYDKDNWKKLFAVFQISAITILSIVAVYSVYSLDRLNKRLEIIENRFGGQSKLACREKDSIDRLKNSVVRVVGGESEGSGFAIKDHLVMTNFHVIEFEPSPKIVFPDNTFETAQIKYADKKSDLAILSVSRPLQAVVWGDSDGVELAEELIILGFPFGGELVGELSVSTGRLSAHRYAKEDNIDYLQIDGTLNPGVSGGPMINICGEVIGINTAGTAGLGLAISATSAQDKWFEMLSDDDPLRDVKKITFSPNASPLDAVSSFYNYLKIRKMKEAYNLLSDNFLKGGSFENWKIGYESLLDTTVIKIEKDPERENVVIVKLSTKDLIDDEIVYKYFEGWWEVREEKGKLKLYQPKIREVKDPDMFWFWE